MQPKPKRAEVVNLADLRTLRVEPSRGTLSEAWEYYQGTAFYALAKPSQTVYKQVAKLAIAELPTRPKAGDVRAWLIELVRDQDYAPATANKFLRILKAITEAASYAPNSVNLNLRNAFRQVKPEKLPRKEKRDAPRDTVKRLLELAATPFERLAIRLAAFYALRCGEIVALKPSDVRNDRDILRVRVHATRDNKGYRDRKNAKNEKEHVVDIVDGETAGIVLSLCNEDTRISLAHRAQKELARTWLIPWGHAHAQHLMERWRQDEGVQLGTGDAWHALRHYSATALAAKGAGLATIQAHLGDSTATAAMCYMAQVRGTTHSSAALVLDDFNDERSNHCSWGGGVTRDAGRRHEATPPGIKSDTSCRHESYTTQEENP